MKRKMNVLKGVGVLSLISLLFLGCKKEFVSSDSDLQGDHNFGTASQKYAVAAYNRMVNPVQTSGLASNNMGIYNDPVYDQTIANVVTQVIPKSYNPVWGTNPVFDSIIVTIPYFSRLVSTDSDGNNIYELDSIFEDQPMKLSVYRSNYFINDYDPEDEQVENQIYYSNLNVFDGDSNLGELLYVNENFTIDRNPISLGDHERDENGDFIYDENGERIYVEDTKIAPSLRLKLEEQSAEFWENLFFPPQSDDSDAEAPFQPELSNRNNFTNYFRGLYFKVEPVNGSGSYFMLDFEDSGAGLNLYFTNEDEDNERDQDVFEMSFIGNRINIINNDPSNTLIENADANADEFNGDEQLFLKGGQGSAAIIDLFKDEAEYDDFMTSFKDDYGKPSRLINEANIIIYTDQDAVFSQSESQEPERVTLFDLKNNVPIIDYYYDIASSNTSDPLYSKTYHSTLLEKDENGRGYRYKIRMTEHLNNILLKDSTNFKLGLFVSTNVNSITPYKVFSSSDLEYIPDGTVLSPKGTILHGSNPNVPEDRRIQLEIFYTEPDQN